MTNTLTLDNIQSILEPDTLCMIYAGHANLYARDVKDLYLEFMYELPCLLHEGLVKDIPYAIHEYEVVKLVPEQGDDKSKTLIIVECDGSIMDVVKTANSAIQEIVNDNVNSEFRKLRNILHDINEIVCSEDYVKAEAYYGYLRKEGLRFDVEALIDNISEMKVKDMLRLWSKPCYKKNPNEPNKSLQLLKYELALAAAFINQYIEELEGCDGCVNKIRKMLKLINDKKVATEKAVTRLDSDENEIDEDE